MSEPRILTWLPATLLGVSALTLGLLTPSRWARSPGAAILQVLVVLALLGATLAAMRPQRQARMLALAGAAIGAAHWLTTHVLRSAYEEAPRPLVSLELIPFLASLAALVLLLRLQSPDEERYATRHAHAAAFAIGFGIVLTLSAYAVALSTESYLPSLGVGYHQSDIEYPPGMPAETTSPFLNHSDSWSLTLPNYVGQYYYHCMPHDELMYGAIQVTDDPTAPTALNLTIRDFAFDTPEPVIRTGGTITWTNTGQAQHDVMILGYAPPAKHGIPSPELPLVLTVLGAAALLVVRRPNEKA